MTDQTPSPQSVVAELLKHSVAHYGHPKDETCGVGLLHAQARALLAALSLEAPARDGEQWGWRVRSKPNKFIHDRPWHWQFDEPTGITAENCEYEPVYTSALTPRHEAPADPFAAEDACLACHEAPAEGAGVDVIEAIEDVILEHIKANPGVEPDVYGEEAAAEMIFEKFIRPLLRARSSAPEDEGEAVRRQRCTRCDRGEVFGMSDDSGFWVEFSSVAGGGNEHGMNGWLELVEHWPDGRDVRREYVAKDSPLYAAPSADKLRLAVEALERIAHEPRPVTRAAMREYAAEALATLKAEGAK